MLRRLSMTTKADLLWILTGIFLAIAWWGYQMTLPPLFRGITCCDSQTYMTQARMIVHPKNDTQAIPALKIDQPSQDVSAGIKTETPTTQSSSANDSRVLKILRTLFSSTAVQLPGYPVYLASSIMMSNVTGGGVAWIPLSLFIALLLHIVSSLVFVTILRRAGVMISGSIVMIILALPAMTALAAQPLSDSLATSVLLLALAGTIHVVRNKKLPWAFPVGLVWAYLLWTRSSHVPAVGMFFGILIVMHVLRYFRGINHALLPLCILCAGLAVGFLPRVIACTIQDGRPCVTPGAVAQRNAVILLHEGFAGARTYTVIQPASGGMILTIPDSFFRSLQPACDITMETSGRDLIRCAQTHWWKMPWLGVEKLFGLFDQSHLNPHATYVTPPIMRWILRVMMVPALLGFLSLLTFLLFRLATGRLTTKDILRFGYFPLHTATILPLAIEQRYGLPLFAVSMIGFGLLCIAWKRWDGKMRMLSGLGMTAIAATFILVTAGWDRNDPVPYVPMKTAAITDSLELHQKAIETVKVKY